MFSLHRFWQGGTGLVPPTGGVRGMQAPWMGGGASVAVSPPSGAGVRSLLAFWMGGASSGAFIPPEPPVSQGGGFRAPPKRLGLRRIVDDDEEVILAVIAAFFTIHPP